jgi:predicted amidophosphoribosyltransferase
MIQHKCWRCQKVEAAHIEWQFCPHCGAPFQDRHRVNTQNMPIEEWIAGHKAWRERNEVRTATGGQQS